MENMFPPYERRTRSRRGVSGESINNDTNQGDNIMTKNIHPNSAKEMEGTIEISPNFESHDNMGMGKDLNPVDKRKDGNQRQMNEGINKPPDDPGESKNQMQ